VFAQMSERFGAKSMVFFSLLMLIKGFVARFVIFGAPFSWATLYTEIPFVLIVYCLIEWFATKRKLAAYLLANLLLTGVFFSVIMYYKYYGVIVTYRALHQVNQVTAVSNSKFSLLDPYFLFIFSDVLILAYLLFNRKRAAGWKRALARRVSRKTVAAVFAVSVALTLFNIFPNRASMNEMVKAGQMGILNYEAYTLLDRPKEEKIAPADITQAAIDAAKGANHPASPLYEGAAKGKNLIVIQLESFQNFLIGLTIDGQEVTPVLNRLARSAFYFPHFYQQVGQGNTSDAEFVVNTSFYVPPEEPAVQSYAGKRLPSLPRLLGANGYDTATFHTNTVEFWNRGELYSALGFDRYYDQSFFGEDDKVFFGSSDEVLYAKTAAELERMNDSGRPFYAQVISMSAHHPFTIPEEKWHMTLPERYEGTLVGDYIRAQNYADYALGLFIDDLKRRGVWDDSLIVIYGDHVGLPASSLSGKEKDLMEEIFGHDYGYKEMINIPLIIAGEGVTSPARFEQAGGQADILPTVANLLGVSLADQIHFGQDLLNNPNHNLIPERYYLPTGSFLNNEELFVPGSGFEDGEHYPLSGEETDRPLSTKDEFDRALRLLNLSDSYVSQLPDKDAPAQ